MFSRALADVSTPSDDSEVEIISISKGGNPNWILDAGDVIESQLEPRINAFALSTRNTCRDVARGYLEGCDWDVDSAVNSYKNQLVSNIAQQFGLDETAASVHLVQNEWDAANTADAIVKRHTKWLTNIFGETERSTIDTVLQESGGNFDLAIQRLTGMNQEADDDTCPICDNRYDTSIRRRSLYCIKCNDTCCAVCRVRHLQVEKERFEHEEGWFMGYTPKCHLCKSKLRDQWDRFPEVFNSRGCVKPAYDWGV